MQKLLIHLNIHIGLKALFDPPAVVIDLLQVLLLIFIRPNHHLILQETKTLVSFSYRVFSQEILRELCILNKNNEGWGSSFEKKTSFADCLSQCADMIDLEEFILSND